MPRKPTDNQRSINGALYERLQARARAAGVPVSRIVEHTVNAALDDYDAAVRELLESVVPGEH